jgi:hypothetical protein
MKTAFKRDGYKFEPEPVIYSTGPDGRARVVRPWQVYTFNQYGYWVHLGTRFYSPRTLKKDIR